MDQCLNDTAEKTRVNRYLRPLVYRPSVAQTYGSNESTEPREQPLRELVR
jgi:hypothetical protein